MTVVFCDLADSTNLGEQLDPESLRRVISRYYEEMTRTVERHGGTTVKFIGDAVMAVFGMPVVHENDALRAVRTAAEMSPALDRLNRELEERWGVRLDIRTGVNTGEVVVCEPGSAESAVVGEVVGDAVNVAARLEQAATAGEVLIGADTYRLVRDTVDAEAVEPLEVKGKARPVRAYRLLDVVSGEADGARPLDSPIVGRDRELEQLTEAFERVVTGERCELVTVLGPAGIGKSRLVHELTERIGDRATTLKGRCLPYGEGITFWPIAEIAREVTGIGEGKQPEEVAANVAALLPDDESASDVVRAVADAIGVADTSADTAGDRVGGPPAVRGAGPQAPGDRRVRRHPLGGGHLPGPDRGPGREESRRPDARRVHGPRGAAGAAAGLGSRNRGRRHARARSACERRQ